MFFYPSLYPLIQNHKQSPNNHREDIKSKKYHKPHEISEKYPYIESPSSKKVPRTCAAVSLRRILTLSACQPSSEPQICDLVTIVKVYSLKRIPVLQNRQKVFQYRITKQQERPKKVRCSFSARDSYYCRLLAECSGKVCCGIPGNRENGESLRGLATFFVFKAVVHSFPVVESKTGRACGCQQVG